MCGEIPVGHFKIDVIVHFNANESSVVVPLQRQLEHIREVRLNEYCIVAPNGGAVTPNIWRLSLGAMLTEDMVTNVVGSGYCFVVDNAVCTHVHYDNPRLFTTNSRGYIRDLQVKLSTVSVSEAPATFTEATFFLSFVCKDPLWSPEAVIAKDLALPQNAMGQFSTRAPFF